MKLFTVHYFLFFLSLPVVSFSKSIHFFEIDPPTVRDTSFCGPGQYFLNVQNGSGINLAYGSAEGSNIVGMGVSNLALTLNESQDLYVSTASSVIDHIGPSESLGATATFLNGTRGAFFDVYKPLILDSVDVYVETTSELLIELKNAEDEVIHSKTVFLNNSGKHEIALGFSVVPGTGYSLLGTPISGRMSFVIPGASYPYSIENAMDITRPTHPSLRTVAYYFFDWVVSYVSEESPRRMVNVEIAENPSVELGEDRLNCGNVILDATNSNASYLWSTNETTPTIEINASGMVSVSVSIENCIVNDTVVLEILEEPTLPVVNNQSICGPAEISFVNENPAPFTIWYDKEVAGKVVGLGNIFKQDIAETTTLFATNANATTKALGEEKPFDETFRFAGGKRGAIFNVMEPIIIEQVSVFADFPVRLLIELQNAEGEIVQSANVWVPRGEGNETIIPLNFEVLPGEDYQLLGFPQGSGQLAFNFPQADYPYEIPGVISITKSTHPNRFLETFYTFFNWVIKYPECHTERVPLNYSVSVPLELGEPKYTCDQLTLDTQIPGLSHLWNTNATTSTISINQPGTYSVEVNDGQGCIVKDSVEVNFPEPLDLGVDRILCGDILFSNYDNDSRFLWSTSDTTPDIEISTPGTYRLTVLEPQGCELTDEVTITGFDTFPEVNLGPDQIACGSVVLDAGNPGLRYEWSHGPTTQTVEVGATGAYSVIVYNENECSASDTVNISAIRPPESLFSFSTNGLSVSFNNLSSFGNYTWIFGDGGISQNINPTHTYIESGTYSVLLIVSNGCSSDTMRQSVTVNPVGIFHQNWEGDVNIYPNPARNLVNIDLELISNFKDIQVSLSDMRGKVILQEELRVNSKYYSHQLSLPDLTPGVYLINLRQKDKFYHHKLIIQ